MNADDQQVYWDALNRILQGRPRIVKPGERITYDLVCLEAGRTRGSLKASRSQHAEIRQAVRDAFATQTLPARKPSKKMYSRATNKAKNDEIQLLNAENKRLLGQVLMGILRIDKLEQENAELKRPRLLKFVKSPV